MCEKEKKDSRVAHLEVLDDGGGRRDVQPGPELGLDHGEAVDGRRDGHEGHLDAELGPDHLRHVGGQHIALYSLHCNCLQVATRRQQPAASSCTTRP